MTVASVAINARAAVREEIGGVERVARALANELPALDPDRYRVIAPNPALAHRAGHVWEQLALPASAAGSKLILSPANLAPVLSRRNVVIIYDLAPFLGEWYSPGYARWHRTLLPRIARGAQMVLTTSDVVADQIADLLGVDPHRIGQIPLGVDARFARPGDVEELRSRMELRRPYVLALATDLPRKNIALLDRIAPVLAAAGLDVIRAGSSRSYMRKGDYQVRSIGYVAEADLPALYAGAAAVAMPSLYEGFGLPCLEAMAAGTPVVASNRGALPQTCGDAATLVDPEDEAAFANALIALTTDGPDRTDRIARGKRRAAGFTWKAAAAAIDGHLTPLLETR